MNNIDLQAWKNLYNGSRGALIQLLQGPDGEFVYHTFGKIINTFVLNETTPRYNKLLFNLNDNNICSEEKQKAGDKFENSNLYLALVSVDK